MFKKLSKFEYLGIINLVLSLLPGYFLLGTILNGPSAPIITSLFLNYIPNVLLLSSLVTHLYISYKLFWKKQYSKNKFYGYLTLTILAFFWFIWLFIGYFFVTAFIYPIISLILVGIVYYFLQKYWLKIALLAAIISVILVMVTIIFNFEENYCWNKGIEADQTGSAMMTVSAVQAHKIVGNMIDVPATGDATVGKAFYNQMLCHQSFDFMSALKEKY